MLSKACKYAIRAVLYLAVNSGPDRKVGIEKVASSLNLPQPFLSKLLQKLVRQRLISSSKGPGGGFYLKAEELDKPLLGVVESIDGAGVFSDCVLGLEECSETNPCPLHDHFEPFKKKLHHKFTQYSIREIAEDMEKHKLSI